jgi:hypothetical protein
MYKGYYKGGNNMFALLMKLNIVAYIIIFFIIGILLTATMLSGSVKSKYKKILGDLSDKRSREDGDFEHEVLNDIVKDYDNALNLKIKEINTQALIENIMHKHLRKQMIAERFVQKSTSLMIVLGLLGTFYGLTLSIGDIVDLLTVTSETITNDAVGEITGGLMASIQGMSVAFVTSLFGIASSVVIHFIHIFSHLGELRESIIIQTEEYLDNHRGPKGADFGALDENGNTMIEKAFIALSDNLDESFKDLTGVLADSLQRSAGNMVFASEALSGSIDKFDVSLKTFSENTRDFSEFNHHLRTNIERMSVSFDDLTENIKTETKVIKANNNDLTTSSSIAAE